MASSGEARCGLLGGGHAVSSPLDMVSTAALFSVEVQLAMAAPALVDDRLFAVEREYIRRAVAKRRAEFGTARLCARQALRQLGFEAGALIPLPDGSPRWPGGVVGSISHTAGCCAAVVALARDAVGIGLDVEQDSPLPPALLDMVCTTAERGWLALRAPDERGFLGKLIFSAKEAFYKCQFAVTKTLLDFAEVELSMELPGQRFTVQRIHRTGTAWRLVERVEGRWFRDVGLVAAGATLQAQDRCG